MQTRDTDGIVRCRCYKCDAIHAADCGLHLPGVFDRNGYARPGSYVNAAGIGMGDKPHTVVEKLDAAALAKRIEDLPEEWALAVGGPKVAAPRPFTGALNDVPATLTHDEGAYAQCGECGRYTLNANTLTDRPPACDCGSVHGWSGSFKKPGPEARWSGKAPGVKVHGEGQ
jgi:hypothetical protein